VAEPDSEIPFEKLVGSPSLEEEGIFSFFQHSNGSHQLIVSDIPHRHPPRPGQNSIVYEAEATAVPGYFLGWGRFSPEADEESRYYSLSPRHSNNI
jgi:hypothetical protein